MNRTSNLKLLLIFSVTFSLVTLGGPMSSNFHLPTIRPVHALPQPCQTHGASLACSEFWYPAGPEMSTEQVSIFSSVAAEYQNLLSPNPSIDFPDGPLPAMIPTGSGSQLAGPGYYLTDPILTTSYFEIEFMLANTFWNCNMMFGSSGCGTNIRQGVSHMIDKSIFASQDLPLIQPLGGSIGIPIDDPVPTSSGGSLLSANSCLWDASFLESNVAGAPCTVGGGQAGTSVGGASYHLVTATGANGTSWLQAPGSKDLNAAAAHFVLAGLATGCDGGTGVSSCTSSTDSILSGITASTCSVSCPTFFIRNDDTARLDLGKSLAAQICYLFTGSYAEPCAYLNTVQGSIITFPGLQTCKNSICLNWWFYTAGFSGVTFYDDSLYFTYNSRFVSGIPSDQPPCSSHAVPTSIAPDYMYLCSPTYDSLSSQMETSPCLAALGDPAPGSTSNKPTPPFNGLCGGNGSLSSHSAGIQAEDYFGQNAFTMPVFEEKDRYAYLQCQPPGPCTTSNSWMRAINDATIGLANYFTWLNVYNPGAALPGVIRQGFAANTRSVNPFIASTTQDSFIVGNVYDSLYASNPLNRTQQINWMTEKTMTLSQVSYNAGLAGPPPGTAVTYRFVLRPDLSWQDARPLTAYDVAFSYLSMAGSGASLGIGSSSITGMTVLNQRVFDISVNSTGPFVLPNLTSLPIVPGRYWSNAGGSAWDNAVQTCSTTTCQDAQYTLTGSTVNCAGACTIFPSTLMTINPVDTAASFDPILNHIFVGSGPWQCGTVTTNSGSGMCTPIEIGNGYTLTANVNYFRSTTRLAEWIWSGENDINPIGPAAAVGSCFNKSVNLGGMCSHWQQGIGNPGPGTIVGITSVSIVDIFFDVNWIAPFEWTSILGTVPNPPTGIVPFAPTPPILYALTPFDGSTTLTPNPGSNSCSVSNTYYDC